MTPQEELAKLEAQLQDDRFLTKAPPAAIQRVRDKVEKLRVDLTPKVDPWKLRLNSAWECLTIFGNGEIEVTYPLPEKLPNKDGIYVRHRVSMGRFADLTSAVRLVETLDSYFFSGYEPLCWRCGTNFEEPDSAPVLDNGGNVICQIKNQYQRIRDFLKKLMFPAA